jgi:hypothetical protein
LAIVTLSRQLASGGNDIALGVAQALDLRVVDQVVINRAAMEAGVPRAALEELRYEGRRSLVDRMLSVVHAMPAIPTALEPASGSGTTASTMFQGFLSPLHPPMSLSMREYVRVVGLVIRDLAHDGDVIIVGRGGQMVLRDTPGTLHVRVIASFAQRIERLMARREIGGREATAQLRASDRARANYLRRYHGVGWQNPRLYHLMLNTDDIPLSVAIAAGVGACRALDESAQTETLEQDRQESGNDDA